VVVKGLGAGFHQPVESMRYVSAHEQPVLANREADTLDYAKIGGMKVFSTFKMTISRYKDFTEGKCACHFHKVHFVSVSACFGFQLNVVLPTQTTSDLKDDIGVVFYSSYSDLTSFSQFMSLQLHHVVLLKKYNIARFSNSLIYPTRFHVTGDARYRRTWRSVPRGGAGERGVRQHPAEPNMLTQAGPHTELVQYCYTFVLVTCDIFILDKYFG